MMRLPFLIPALLVATTALAADQNVIDDTGRKVTIPEQPERVVVLHEPALGIALSDLGLVPVGSYGRDDNGKTLLAVDFLDVVLQSRSPDPKPKGIGALGNLDLEKLRALEPDLIIGTEYDKDKADLFSAIAPVYLQNSSTGLVRGFGSEEALAGVLNLETEFEERKAQYHERLEDVRSSLPYNPEGKTYLAIFLTDQINAVGQLSGAIQAIEDLGYKRLKLDKVEAISGFGATLLVPISSEIFGRLNPDLLILMSTYTSSERGEATIRATLDRIVPGWEHFLKPARENRVLYLDSAEVTTPTIASAERTLDAFESRFKR
ncbi:ABC transporter substrate-binding protein [Roseibium algae]|uniref:ABC transporter substrate-binding protein n=1 Tax=Roseibium algae TaxID=3123038 RepID=A0ABU8TJ55_9HYPH